MFDYNVEFAHIYADESFGENQIQSIKVHKDLIEKLKKENKLIGDNYSSPFHLFLLSLYEW